MNGNPLTEILNARSIVFYGASGNPTKMGSGLLVTLLTNHYPGAIYPIHPRETEIFGLRAYRSVSEIGEQPELAVIILPAQSVPPLIDELGAAGIRRAVIVTAGFDDEEYL